MAFKAALTGLRRPQPGLSRVCSVHPPMGSWGSHLPLVLKNHGLSLNSMHKTRKPASN